MAQQPLLLELNHIPILRLRMEALKLVFFHLYLMILSPIQLLLVVLLLILIPLKQRNL